MDPVSDDFLLALADISAALTGLFLVGMILYIQIGYEGHQRSRTFVEPYFRAATSITFIAFAAPVAVSLTLVALPIVWSVLIYYVLVLALVVADISTVATVRKLQREMRFGLLVMIEVVGTAVVALMIILPFVTGGFSIGREDLVPGLLLSLGVAFLSTWVLVLTLFDIARFERSEPPVPRFGGALANLRQRRNRGAVASIERSDAPEEGGEASDEETVE